MRREDSRAPRKRPVHGKSRAAEGLIKDFGDPSEKIHMLGFRSCAKRSAWAFKGIDAKRSNESRGDRLLRDCLIRFNCFDSNRLIFWGYLVLPRFDSIQFQSPDQVKEEEIGCESSISRRSIRMARMIPQKFSNRGNDRSCLSRKFQIGEMNDKNDQRSFDDRAEENDERKTRALMYPERKG